MPFLTAIPLNRRFHYAEFPGISRASCEKGMLQLRNGDALLDRRGLSMLSKFTDASNGAGFLPVSAKMRSPDMATTPPILTRPGQ